MAREDLHPERRALGLHQPHAEHITVAVQRDSKRRVERAWPNRTEPVRSSSASVRRAIRASLGDAVDIALIDDPTVGMEEVERDRGAAPRRSDVRGRYVPLASAARTPLGRTLLFYGQAGGLPGGPAAGYLCRAAPRGELRAVCVLAEVDRVRGRRARRCAESARLVGCRAASRSGGVQAGFVGRAAAPRRAGRVPRPVLVRCCVCAEPLSSESSECAGASGRGRSGGAARRVRRLVGARLRRPVRRVRRRPGRRSSSERGCRPWCG